MVFHDEWRIRLFLAYTTRGGKHCWKTQDGIEWLSNGSLTAHFWLRKEIFVVSRYVIWWETCMERRLERKGSSMRI